MSIHLVQEVVYHLRFVSGLGSGKTLLLGALHGRSLRSCGLADAPRVQWLDVQPVVGLLPTPGLRPVHLFLIQDGVLIPEEVVKLHLRLCPASRPPVP